MIAALGNYVIADRSGRVRAGHRTAFATAAEWVARLADAQYAGRLQDELVKLGRIPLLIIDEVGYIPFEAEAANLFFQLVSSRYEQASLIVTSNKPFGRWGEVFGDDVVAAAMIDRLVHAEVISLKGEATGSRTATSAASPPPARPTTDQPELEGVRSRPSPGGPNSAPLTTRSTSSGCTAVPAWVGARRGPAAGLRG